LLSNSETYLYWNQLIVIPPGGPIHILTQTSLTHLGPLVKVLAETILGKNRKELIVRVFVVKWE